MSSLLFKLLMGKGAISEAIETFRLNLSNPSGGATLAKSFGTGTIQQNPILPAFVSSRELAANTGVAPFSIQFDASPTTAIGLTNLPFHELYFAWTFGDYSGGATWGTGAKAGVALKNEANGPIAAHVFEASGTYTVTMTAYHLAANGTLTIAEPITKTITVTSADTVFPGANTVCIANGTLPVAGVDGVPSGATCVNQSSWAAISAYTTAGKRVLLKRGDTWIVPDVSDPFSINNAGPGILGAYGTGAAPSIYCDYARRVLVLSASNDWRILDININGDKTIDTWGVNSSGRQAIYLLNTTHTLVRGYEASGMDFGINGVGNTNLSVVSSYVHDSVDVQLGSIGMYIESTFGAAMMGCKVERITQNHSSRWQGATKAIFSHNTIISARATAHLLAIRNMPDSTPGVWSGVWSEDIVISDNYLDSSILGVEVIKVAPTDSITGGRLRNVIIERNYVQSYNRACIMANVSSNQTIRNNICVTSYWYCSIVIQGASSTPGLTPAPVSSYVYNNTMYQPAAGGFGGGYSGVFLGGDNVDSWPQGTILKNNLCYAPAATKDGNSNGSAPTFYCIANVGCPLPTLENNSSNAQVKSSLPFSSALPLTPSDFSPAGYSLDGGTYVPVTVDYTTEFISGAREIGAIQA